MSVFSLVILSFQITWSTYNSRTVHTSPFWVCSAVPFTMFAELGNHPQSQCQRTFPPSQKETPYPMLLLSNPFISPALSVSVDFPVLGFPVNESQHKWCSVSGSSHVFREMLAGVSALFLSKDKSHSIHGWTPLCVLIPPLMDSWVVFCLLTVMSSAITVGVHICMGINHLRNRTSCVIFTNFSCGGEYI